MSTELDQKISATVAVLKQAENEYPSVVFANSLGAEDMVLTDLLAKHAHGIGMFSLDTGRLPKETYDLIQEVSEQYTIPLKVYFPDSKLRGVRRQEWYQRLLRQCGEPQGLLLRAQG